MGDIVLLLVTWVKCRKGAEYTVMCFGQYHQLSCYDCKLGTAISCQKGNQVADFILKSL